MGSGTTAGCGLLTAAETAFAPIPEKRTSVMERVLDKVALISGAARGIGAAIAARLHGEGAKVVLGDVLEEEIRAENGTLPVPQAPGIGLRFDEKALDRFAVERWS